MNRPLMGLVLGLLFGVLTGFVLALPIAHMNATHYDNTSCWWKILLPPTLLGAFVGYGTVRFGKPARSKERIPA